MVRSLQAMLESSRETCSGIQLEVNEKILDSCNQLMKVALFSVFCVILSGNLSKVRHKCTLLSAILKLVKLCFCAGYSGLNRKVKSATERNRRSRKSLYYHFDVDIIIFPFI